MARVRSRVAAHARHKKILNLAEGHRGKRRTNFKLAHESVQHALKYSTEHRKDRKGDFVPVRVPIKARSGWSLRSRGLPRAVDARARTTAGLSQNDLASKLKAAQQNVQRLEKGGSTPPTNTLLVLRRRPDISS